MGERPVNWELKVEQLRQALEKQALERTFDVRESSRSPDFISIGDISEVNSKWLISLYYLINRIEMPLENVLSIISSS